MKECYLYKKLKGGKVQCQACNHYCVIKPSERGKPQTRTFGSVRGKCGVRENQNGKLYALTYGQPCAIALDPIEKKPLYHFLPNTQTLSIATAGCNFSCVNCQNWTISQAPKQRPLQPHKRQIAPQKIVDLTLKYQAPSISYTYTEPTVFLEYALDIMKLAKKAGLKNIWVSNGFFSKETFNLIKPYLDAANIDLKGFSENFYQQYCGGRLEPVLDNLKRLYQAKIHLEITTLIVPTLNDDSQIFQGIANFIKTQLAPDVPWHLSRFSPEISYKLQHLSPTPLETLKKAEQIGRQTGLKNIYLGNI